MPYNDDHYFKDPDGDYRSREEAERAAENGHLDRTSDGGYWDRQTGESYWADGTKK